MPRTNATVVLFVLLIAAVAAPLSAAASTARVRDQPNPGTTFDANDSTGGNVSVTVAVTNGTVARSTDGSPFVWRNGSKTLAARTTPNDDHRHFRVCLSVAGRNESERDCRKHSLLTSAYNVTDEYTFADWPTNRTGRQTVTATVEDPTNGTVLARTNASVFVVLPGDDFDDDRLRNAREVKAGTGINQTDSDRDGLKDGPEVMEYGTDPLSNDTDQDGLTDATEVDRKTNATRADTDGDGLEDGPEVNDYDTDPTDPDTDGDGLDDAAEVRGITDPTDPDTDDDGLDDAAEVNNVYGDTNATNPDTDDDGLDDGPEVHVYNTDPTSEDTDGDFLNDASEVSIGTDPTNPLSTVFIAVGVLAVLAVLLAVRRHMLPEIASLGRRGSTVEASEAEGEEPDGASPDPVPPGMLSDEDRVLQLLRQENGRLPQNEITEMTDWSKSKVSRLLSRMEDEGAIQKINVGRQNIIALEDAVPESAKSPFEDAAQHDDS